MKEILKIYIWGKKIMKKIEVLKANKKHKEFIIHANNIINNVNDTEQTNGLKKNIDKDYFCDNPKFHCLHC